jgi:bidirectional [NiFe] hydrogenase diaphorase subunit
MSIGTVTLKIDDMELTVPEGTSILNAAKANGITIPTLCYLEGLTPWGGCRICMVEIHGTPKLFPACATPVNRGMEVVTQSDKLREYRKMVVQLLLSERTHICSVCVANNSCELQKLANELGVDHVMFDRNWTEQPIDSTHNFLVIDRNRCILCMRCVRVCNEIEGVHTLDVKQRGKDTQVIVDLDQNWADSTSCTSCRKCAKVCPVGAIYVESEALSETKDKEIAEFVLSRRNR